MAARKGSDDLRELYEVTSRDGVKTTLKLSPEDAKRYAKAGAKKVAKPKKVGVARPNKAAAPQGNKAA